MYVTNPEVPYVRNLYVSYVNHCFKFLVIILYGSAKSGFSYMLHLCFFCGSVKISFISYMNLDMNLVWAVGSCGFLCSSKSFTFLRLFIGNHHVPVRL